MNAFLQTLPKSSNTLMQIKEGVQYIALYGLWRSGFFEVAAFYGGTCLRICYGLQRFSEDLDFSLLTPCSNFEIEPYLIAINKELASYGFKMTATKKEKAKDSPILSAFIKGNTVEHILLIEPASQSFPIHHRSQIKIKIEVDLAPPGGFETEERAISSPTPFPVRTYVLEDLFAGKIHAALFRPWKTRVKGRDWFDVLWYLSKGVALNLNHVKTRAIDSGDLDPEALWNAEVFMEFLRRKIESVNWEQAKADVAPFLEDPSCLEGWSSSLFLQMIEKIRYC